MRTDRPICDKATRICPISESTSVPHLSVISGGWGREVGQNDWKTKQQRKEANFKRLMGQARDL